MHRIKRDIWKVAFILVSLLFILVFMVWIPMSAADASNSISGLPTPTTETVQTTPTVDATVTALNKDKLAQEVQQLKVQNSQDLSGWFRTNATIFLSTLVVVTGGLFGLFRWFEDRRDVQARDLRAQAEERFKDAVTALGDEKESTQVGGAILLRSFLNPDDEFIYGRYYTQIFGLAVAYLRPSSTSQPIGDPNLLPLPLTPLRQALVVVFKEAFPLARSKLDKKESPFDPQSLDASRIRLDEAFLVESDLNWLGAVGIHHYHIGYYQPRVRRTI